MVSNRERFLKLVCSVGVLNWIKTCTCVDCMSNLLYCERLNRDALTRFTHFVCPPCECTGDPVKSHWITNYYYLCMSFGRARLFFFKTNKRTASQIESFANRMCNCLIRSCAHEQWPPTQMNEQSSNYPTNGIICLMLTTKRTNANTKKKLKSAITRLSSLVSHPVLGRQCSATKQGLNRKKMFGALNKQTEPNMSVLKKLKTEKNSTIVVRCGGVLSFVYNSAVRTTAKYSKITIKHLNKKKTKTFLMFIRVD